MRDFMKLADLLEEAARALRECGNIISKIPGQNDAKISSLSLSIRAFRALDRAGIGTLNQLTKMSEQDLLDLHGFGYTSLSEIKAMLTKYGLALKE